MKIKAFGKVGLIYGGKSAEREVSLKSGEAVSKALKKIGISSVLLDGDGNYLIDKIKLDKVDRCLIMQHGGDGENGVLQELLENIHMPYTGSSSMGCSLAMDKLLSKQTWLRAGIVTPRFRQMKDYRDIEDLKLPLAVKPINQGSSLGISKVSNLEHLEQAYMQAKKYGEVIAEEWIEGKEITVSIVNGHILPSVWIKPSREFYDYDAKYSKDSGTQYYCPSNLDDKVEAEIQKIAESAFSLIHCSGWGRVDFIIDEKQNPYLIEVNTVPGMTELSLVPQAAKAYGWSFDDLVLEILKTSQVKN
ncbi:D-alanine--D-alanine ligase [Thiotrichales bacterium 19S11-10]|nr:D-alanine--D-alanine ligase [Thiotrichales bacterium 19S11-10]